jgi:hypothetical protein
LEAQPPDRSQTTQIIDEPEGAEEPDGRTERDGLGPADQGHGHQQPYDDWQATAARRRDRVRRAEAWCVYGGQPTKQRDDERLSGDDDNAAGHDGPRYLVPPHRVNAIGPMSFL